MTLLVTEEAQAQIEVEARRLGMSTDEFTRQVFSKLLELPEVLEQLKVEGNG